MVREADRFHPAAWRSIGATSSGRASESNGDDVVRLISLRNRMIGSGAAWGWCQEN